MCNLKHIFIIYYPGYAGNFLQRIFSLSENSAPIFYKEELEKKSFFELGLIEKLEKYRFSKIDRTFPDWQQYHRSWADFYDYDDIIDLLPEGEYKSICFSMHEPEYNFFKTKIDAIDNKIILGVDLDQSYWSSWLENSQKNLKFIYRFEENKFYQKLISELPSKHVIDLNKILDSENGFLEEYHRICDLTEIQEQKILALELYRDWFDCRVKNVR